MEILFGLIVVFYVLRYIWHWFLLWLLRRELIEGVLENLSKIFPYPLDVSIEREIMTTYQGELVLERCKWRNDVLSIVYEKKRRFPFKHMINVAQSGVINYRLYFLDGNVVAVGLVGKVMRLKFNPTGACENYLRMFHNRLGDLPLELHARSVEVELEKFSAEQDKEGGD